MKSYLLSIIMIVFLGIGSSSLSQTTPSKPVAGSGASSSFTTKYPEDSTGVLIKNSGWTEIPNEMPSEIRVKRGIIHSFTYGVVPAAAVASYDGAHAQVRVQSGQPILCICHVPSLPSAPVIVRLHAKKVSRELDGGKLPIIGGKVVQTTKHDLVAVDLARPEGTVWLLRPRTPMLPGEYAVMLGTQNMDVFPFTVSSATSDASASPTGRH